jgi:hypothetical protein
MKEDQNDLAVMTIIFAFIVMVMVMVIVLN